MENTTSYKFGSLFLDLLLTLPITLIYVNNFHVHKRPLWSVISFLFVYYWTLVGSNRLGSAQLSSVHENKCKQITKKDRRNVKNVLKVTLFNYVSTPGAATVCAHSVTKPKPSANIHAISIRMLLSTLSTNLDKMYVIKPMVGKMLSAYQIDYGLYPVTMANTMCEINFFRICSPPRSSNKAHDVLAMFTEEKVSLSPENSYMLKTSRA